MFSLSKKLLKSSLLLRWFELFDLSRVNEEKRKEELEFLYCLIFSLEFNIRPLYFF